MEQNNNSLNTVSADLQSGAVGTAAVKTVKHKHANLDKRKARKGYFFVAPFVLGVIMIYLPMLADSISFSLMNMKTETWVGFQYYQTVIFGGTAFVQTLLSGLQQLIFEVPAIIIFSLFIAVVLNNKMPGRAVFRAIFFVPVIISTGLMQSINAQDIISNMTQNGINDGSGANTATQIVSVLDIERLFESMKVGGELVTYIVNLVNSVYDIINYSGVQMLIFLAGLQSISPSIYEASKMEGATGWETFWKITFPMISPMILVNAVYTIIDSFTKSNNVMMKFINQTYTISTEQATAMSWIYFVVVMLIIGIFSAIASAFIFYQRKD